MFPPDLRLLPDSYFLFWLYQSYLQYIKLVNKKVNIYVPTFRCFWKNTWKKQHNKLFFDIPFFDFRFSFVLIQETRNPKKYPMYIQYILWCEKRRLPYGKYTQRNDRFSGKDRFVVFNCHLLQTILIVYTSFLFSSHFFFIYSYLNTTPSSLSR